MWHVGGIDQGTTSTRVILYNQRLEAVVSHQVEHRQITPQPGWLQHDPEEIFANTLKCIEGAVEKLKAKLNVAAVSALNLRGFGITNQRETVVVWDKATGKPLHDAVVWCDLRSQDVVNKFAAKHGKEKYHRRTGLLPSPYFSGFKLKWLCENVREVAEGLREGRALVGTVDAWLLWKLTGEHATSVCNASRTYLYDLIRHEWDAELCAELSIPTSSLPKVHSNCHNFGVINRGAAAGVPVTALIGDQQSACVGQLCLSKGEVKNTYGTGCFLLMNTGHSPQYSQHGLLTTVCYQLGETAPVSYALEGSVVQAGMLITWLKDNLRIVESPQEVQRLAGSVSDSGGVAIVPAFAGLFAPHWRPDARGIICGLTMYTKREHICRAALVSVAMQCLDVIDAMEKDSGIRITNLKADGGLSNNLVLMQLQADLANLRLEVPEDKETTALGSAICAAIGCGAIRSEEEARKLVAPAKARSATFGPSMSDEVRKVKTIRWRKAVLRSHDWVESNAETAKL